MFVLIKKRGHKFCLTLSGLTDIYDWTGCFVNVMQKVDILPHERYDAAMRVLDTMTKMRAEISCHKQTGNCVWPNYHEYMSCVIECLPE